MATGSGTSAINVVNSAAKKAVTTVVKKATTAAKTAVKATTGCAKSISKSAKVNTPIVDWSNQTGNVNEKKANDAKSNITRNTYIDVNGLLTTETVQDTGADGRKIITVTNEKGLKDTIYVNPTGEKFKMNDLFDSEKRTTRSDIDTDTGVQTTLGLKFYNEKDPSTGETKKVTQKTVTTDTHGNGSIIYEKKRSVGKTSTTTEEKSYWIDTEGNKTLARENIETTSGGYKESESPTKAGPTSSVASTKGLNALKSVGPTTDTEGTPEKVQKLSVMSVAQNSPDEIIEENLDSNNDVELENMPKPALAKSATVINNKSDDASIVSESSSDTSSPVITEITEGEQKLNNTNIVSGSSSSASSSVITASTEGAQEIISQVPGGISSTGETLSISLSALTDMNSYITKASERINASSTKLNTILTNLRKQWQGSDADNYINSAANLLPIYTTAAEALEYLRNQFIQVQTKLEEVQQSNIASIESI